MSHGSLSVPVSHVRELAYTLPDPWMQSALMLLIQLCFTCFDKLPLLNGLKAQVYGELLPYTTAC